ncbi:hypothetical protein [Rhizobium tropici]|uniref:Uncharacterized protein n=1 Tax=Rhizobium tropici TaxID=398 RepID=A0A329Y3I8_RHITR|nr:hypothetical protein [Rhizobium tropici]RAX37847.1 hypothetical protein DQ393_29595 [Rhizobium tropici]
MLQVIISVNIAGAPEAVRRPDRIGAAIALVQFIGSAIADMAAAHSGQVGSPFVPTVKTKFPSTSGVLTYVRAALELKVNGKQGSPGGLQP